VDSDAVPAEDAVLAEELAERAGALLLELRAGGADGNTGDRRSDEFLLAELAARRPGDAVLSEESPDPPPGSGSSTRWTAPGSTASRGVRTGPCTSRSGPTGS
jgi:3'(2'), 5'-bisphosphate nucleotidase